MRHTVRLQSVFSRRRLISVGILAIVLILLGWDVTAQAHGGMPRAQKHESRREIDQLEERWRDALLNRDTTTMASLLADDYMAITPSGTLQTKDQTLDGLRSGRWHFTTLNLSDRKVRFYGTTALVTSIADVQGTTPDGRLSGSYRYTRVYARNPQGNWKIVNFEASRIADPGEHK